VFISSSTPQPLPDLSQRYLRSNLAADLQQKMVLLGGPRQVGKTSLARSLLSSPSCEMNYDIPTQRQRILQRELPDTPIWFFDEIHKYRGWRNYLKGIVDEMKQPGVRQRQVLVTGSARLDLYRYGGDSLQGRYLYMRLHPLSVAELCGMRGQGGTEANEALAQLMALGGFPEPFFNGQESFARRWRLSYRERLIREEVTALEQVSDLGKLELLALALPERVGSPLSLNNLREDLQVQHATVARWVEVLERLYAIFRLAPFTGSARQMSKLRAVKKEQKHFHYDWGLVSNPGARFENLVACHLLKWVEFQVDTQGHDVQLRYFRDIDGREVDFVILHDQEPVAFIECKLSDSDISGSLNYLHQRFPQATCWQISATGIKDYINPVGIRVAPAARLLEQLV
jgi:uncharacterized protein